MNRLAEDAAGLAGRPALEGIDHDERIVCWLQRDSGLRRHRDAWRPGHDGDPTLAAYRLNVASLPLN